jgi:hypothetical protein
MQSREKTAYKYCDDLPEPLAELLKATFLRRTIELFAKVAPANRYLRRRSQARIVGQHSLTEEAHRILKLGAILFVKRDVHRRPPRERARERDVGPPPEKMKAQ